MKRVREEVRWGKNEGEGRRERRKRWGGKQSQGGALNPSTCVIIVENEGRSRGEAGVWPHNAHGGRKGGKGDPIGVKILSKEPITENNENVLIDGQELATFFHFRTDSQLFTSRVNSGPIKRRLLRGSVKSVRY